MALVDGLMGANTMATKGLHYGNMCVDVYTPKSTEVAYGTTTYQQLLENYISMGNFYAPGVYQFVAGHTVNYSK